MKKEVFETYQRNFQESIDFAQKVFEQNLSNLWIVVISYYSMYYVANAALYKIGYKIGAKVSHKITAEALIVFVRNKLKRNLLEDYEEAKDEALDIIGRKTDEILESFGYEMEKRSLFQYESKTQSQHLVTNVRELPSRQQLRGMN